MSFLAISTYETVVVPLLSDFTPDSAAHLIRHSESVVLFTDKDIWPNLDIKEMPGVKAVISVNDFTLLFSRDASIKAAFDGISKAFSSKFPLGFNRENVNLPKNNDKDVCVIKMEHIIHIAAS